MKFEYLKYFPYDSIRNEQTIAIDFALDSFLNSSKKFCIIEAGTGVGKSAVGFTVAKYLNDKAGSYKGCYFLTTQKILQDQYEKDYQSIISLKSSSNYSCKYHKKNTCAESQQLLRTAEKSSRFFKSCAFDCIYKKKKQEFIDSSFSVTNFPYFLTESNYSRKIKKRGLLIIDEGHNVESELSRFVEVSVSEHFSKNLLNLRFPSKPTQFRVFKWIIDTYLPMAQSKISYYEKTIERLGGERFKEKLQQFQKITRQFDLLKSHVNRLEHFVKIYDKDNWVFDISRSGVRNSIKATFKPIDVSSYSEESLFRLGDKILIMSATIIDRKTFCRTLGIDEADCSFKSIPSPFNPKNRPVIFSPVGSMCAREIDSTLPRLASAVTEILLHHKDEKGIIHCKTFKIANYLKNNIGDKSLSKRILVHDSSNRDEILKKHMMSKDPTVLLSPSMTEGVDLKDEASRFQILCKVPYPYLGDKLVKKRMNKFPGWYNLQTAKSIVQSAGRSIRNESDHATTYILDSDFDKFLSRNRRLFPEDFKNCLIG